MKENCCPGRVAPPGEMPPASCINKKNNPSIIMRTCLSLLLLFCCTLSFAQRTDITVKVTDQKSNPLPGVSVVIKGSVRTGITKDDGTLTITVPDPKKTTFIFNSTGFKSQEIALDGRTSIAVVLQESAVDLENVIVVSALGLTRKAKSVTYSSQTVNAEVLTEARDVNIVNGLAGKVAGLQVTTTGQPGSSSRVVIRGEGSISGNNQPLWVVDGVPIANNITEMNNLDYGNTAADLNPDDIESIEVLKGPNAAALYGSMAANGAILVTTKKGKPGDKSLGISVNQNMMWYTITEFPAYQNIYGEGGAGNTAGNKDLAKINGAVNMGTSERSWGAPMLGQPFNDYSGKPIPGGMRPQPGNVTDFYKTSLTNVSNISLSKADAISSFRLSYTYTKSDDVLQNQNLKNKHNVSLYATRKLGTRVSVDARVLYTLDDTQNRTYRNLSNSSPMAAYVYLQRSTNLSALSPWKDANGNAFGLGAAASSTENPFWMINENSNQDSRNRIIGGVITTVELASYLKLRMQATGDLGFFKGYEYRELGGLQSKFGYFSNRMQDERNWNYEAMLQFSKKINKDISLTANVATNLSSFNSATREAFMDKLLVHDMPSIANANANPRTNEGLARRQIFSVYGNATIGYKDFLFLDVTGRRDESTTLPKANRAYFYPSVGGSFVFSNFIKDRSILSYGKLRASWAKVGNAAPINSLVTAWANNGLFLGNPTFSYANKLNNFDLKPEQTISKEIGLELSLFQRISLTATVYKSNSSNQIITANTPIETGYTQRVVNAGEMQNKGIELTANVNVLKKKNFSWDVRANWSKNTNKVLSLVDGVPFLNLGGQLDASINAMPGMPYGVILGTTPAHVGDTILVQTNGRVYAEKGKYVGVFRADWLGSLGSTFKYKNFDFSFLFNVKWGGQLFSASYARANTNGNTLETLNGRDAFYFSNVILGENGDERRGEETRNGVFVPYADADRPKGTRLFPITYLAKTDASNNIVKDKDGNMMVGKRLDLWGEPQTIFSDFTTNSTRSLTYDASAIRLSELVLGYTVPNRVFKNGVIKGVRVAAVGRNLWLLYRKTPRGIDPESANTSGNAQGIESGGSFPYAQYGLDFKVSF
jgi:TonB-linked SusC/RagA family outer membrane protein